jgi:hypothetical protein
VLRATIDAPALALRLPLRVHEFRPREVPYLSVFGTPCRRTWRNPARDSGFVTRITPAYTTPSLAPFGPRRLEETAVTLKIGDLAPDSQAGTISKLYEMLPASS